MLQPPRQYSIERTLPLLVSGLLLLIILTFAWTTYREIRRVSVAAASERLERVVLQLVAAIEQAHRGRINRVQAVAQDPTVVELLQRYRLGTEPSPSPIIIAPADGVDGAGQPVSPTDEAADNGADDAASPPTIPAAVDGPLRRLSESSSQVAGAVLLDREGRLIAQAGRMRSLPLDVSHVGDAIRATGDAGFIGPLRRVDDTLYYEIWAPVLEDETVSGWAGMRRVVSNSESARDLVRGLIGRQATFFVGNRDDALWTDLARVVPAPPEEVRDSSSPMHHEWDDESWFGYARPLETAPWQLLVEVPASAVVAPVRALMWPLAGITGVAMVVVLFGAWAVSRQITAPLRDLTEAAEDIAAGDHSRRVAVVQDDKLGRLARAFNDMAAEVARSQDRLEEQVAERTARLRRTAVELAATRDELVQVERMALLDQLSSGLGHELRNPLGVMRNCTYVLQATLPDAAPETRHYLRVIDEQVRSADQIIEDLLAFGRTRPPQPAFFDIGVAVATAVEAGARSAGITVRREIPDDLPLVYADSEQVGEILRNVIENAVLAMPAHGTLTVTAVHDDPSTVTVRIRDTGPGIAVETRDRVFEPLYTTRPRGIGLGLSVARTLARNNCGDLSVEATNGAGATLALRLPVAGS